MLGEEQWYLARMLLSLPLCLSALPVLNRAWFEKEMQTMDADLALIVTGLQVVSVGKFVGEGSCVRAACPHSAPSGWFKCALMQGGGAHQRVASV